MKTPDEVVPEVRAVTLTDDQWREARRRAEIIRPLAENPIVPQRSAEEAGRRLGLSARTVYSLVNVWRSSGGSLPELVATKPSGGKGRARLTPAIEAVIGETIEHYYLTAQKPRLSAVVKAIRRRCRLTGIKSPSVNTVQARIRILEPRRVTTKREGLKAAQRLIPAPGATPEARAPLDVIQMDHTKIDLIIVDSVSRLPIGRPFLTLAIDEFSRCVVGLCVTLEAPSATSVGLCLTHTAMDKKPWLERIGADCDWPMCGKPKRLYVDNGADFHSEGLRRGCEVHGIALEYRPINRPHYGGIVERVIGTTMQLIHDLPGTTFSNTQDRGTYDSDGKAALTLQELEKWIALAICGPYHNEVHGTLLQPPHSKWANGITEFGAPPLVRDAKAFLVDFLPVVHRSIQRHGFVIDRIGYYGNVLTPWIAERDRCGKFLIRYDPRDLSRIWVLDPKRNVYLEVPYRTLTHPAVTAWEHRAATKRLREEGRAKIDEFAIFSAIEQMRTISDNAIRQSRVARRNHVRRSKLNPKAAPVALQIPLDSKQETADVAPPFDVIEEWF
jgi:putative transposase